MKNTVWLVAIRFVAPVVFAQPKGFNYDEAKVPEHTLPDPLVMVDGSPVKTVKDWEMKRRPEVLELFKKEMYGRAPGRPNKMRFFTLDYQKGVLGGKIRAGGLV